MGEQSTKLIWNPYVPGYFENPYDHLKDCREQNPIHVGVHDSWMFFRHEDVSDILRSNKFDASELSEYFKGKEPYIFKNSNQCPYLSKGTRLWPMYLNGETHKNVRLAMARAFGKLPYETIIEESIKENHRGFSMSKELDLIDYCSQFIFEVVKKLFNITNYENLDKIMQYSNLLAKSQDLFVPRQMFYDINEAFLWGRRIFSGSEYQEMLTSSLKDMDLSEDDVYSMMAISLMAAFETSKDSLALSLYQVIKQPELIDFIIDCDSHQLNLLIEELFRFSSPLQYTIRINKEPLNYGDINIEAHSKLFLCLASANRDSEVFEKPNEIIPDRNPNAHLSFGGGVHFCLGAAIARQEMRYCLKPMISFLKNFKIKEDEKIDWAKQIFMRTAKSFMLEPKAQ